MKLVKFFHKGAEFMKKAERAVDMALSAMAADIIRQSKMQVPVRHGQLKSSGLVRKITNKKYRVEYDKEYALYQHEGMRRDGSHVIRRHTTPGTKIHYLTDPANLVVKKWKSYVTRYLGAI